MKKLRVNRRLYVPVTEEFFKDFYRTADTYRKRRQRAGECACPKSQRDNCDTDCAACAFRRAGRRVQLTDDLPAEGPTLENIVILNALIRALRRELKKLAPEQRKICDLFMAGKNGRESAEILGISARTYSRKWAKVKKELRFSINGYKNGALSRKTSWGK